MSEGSRAPSKAGGGRSRNGAGANGARTRRRSNRRSSRVPPSAAKPAPKAGHGFGAVLPVGSGAAVALAGRVLGAIARQAQTRVPKADLDERDPDYIRESLAGLWLLASLWFRGEVRGLGRIPAEGPVLMVGNHSGGNVTPDTIVFTLAFNTYFGVERRFYQLAHNLVLSMPGLGSLRKYGTVAASPENADKALDSGAALLVYPGGDWEVHRPSWESAKVDFGGRKGFIRLALDKEVPIVPVVSIGGQETALFLSRGEWLAKLLRLDKMFRLKVLPISVAIPWGLNIGDMLGHLPGPSKITIQVLPAVDLRERYGSEPDIDEVYGDLMDEMQQTLTALQSERSLPLIG
ncbi:1-acyl-sn-glycerol-3-phosphate acyltransferase [soil metagenome]